MKYLLILGILAMCWACSKEPPLPTHRPGQAFEIIEPDYTEDILDGNLRFESDTLLLDFENPGILYSIDNKEHRFLNIETGEYATFNPDVPSLKINGQNVEIQVCKIINSTEGKSWYTVASDSTMPENNNIIVIED